MRRLFLFLVVPALTFAPSSHAITFDDGVTHLIDEFNSYPYEGAVIQDSPGGNPTRVNVIGFGEIATFTGGPSGPYQSYLYGTSTVDVSGNGMVGGLLYAHDDTAIMLSEDGIMGTVNLNGSSTFELSGNGELNAVGGHDTSVVTISGGVTTEAIWMADDSEAVVTGGNHEAIQLAGFGTATATVWGGTFTGDSFTLSRNGTLFLYGGSLNSLNVRGEGYAEIDGSQIAELWITGSLAEANVLSGTVSPSIYVREGILLLSGGTVNASIQVDTNGQLTVEGGDLATSDLVVLDTSVVEIHGYGFNYPLGDITDIQGTLTGNLSDGNPLSIGFGRASRARITLVLPEPSSWLMAVIGIGVVSALARLRGVAAVP